MKIKNSFWLRISNKLLTVSIRSLSYVLQFIAILFIILLMLLFVIGLVLVVIINELRETINRSYGEPDVSVSAARREEN